MQLPIETCRQAAGLNANGWPEWANSRPLSGQYARIVDGAVVIAEHVRSFDKGRLIENAAHIEALAAQKRNGNQARGMNRILNVVPSSKTFFKLAAERGHNMGRLTQLLLTVLDLYGSSELEAALCENLASGRIHSAAIQTTLERRRAARGLPPPVPLTFLKGRRPEEVSIVPNSLDSYDRLLAVEDDQ